MTKKPLLAFMLMDAPFESDRTATAFRLLDAALERGIGRESLMQGIELLPRSRIVDVLERFQRIWHW